MQTTWNLKLLYKNPKDPQIEKDVQLIVSAYKKFEKKWKGNTAMLTDEYVLADALKDYEKVYELGSWVKPLWYFQLMNDIKSDDPVGGARSMQIDEILTKEGNRLVFFDLAFGDIKKDMQKKFLRSNVLKPYRYHLEKKFARAKYDLSEAEEKILNITNMTSYQMWVDGVKKMLGAQKIIFKNKEMGIGEATGLVSSLPRKDREVLTNKIIAATKTVAPFAEGEINAVLTIRKTSDDLRGYERPYSSAIIRNQNDERAVMNLAKIVTDHAGIAHRFFKLKRGMLGIDGSMRSFDVNADVGKINRKFSFEESREIVESSFAAVDPEFSAIVKRYVENGQIDAFPRLHKRSGAYCWKHKNLPTFILLNHIPDLDAVRTFAHEMGHAIHGELSQAQSTLYQSYTTSTAEVASTFFENIVFDQVFETLSPREQIIALHDKILGNLNTIFLQIAFFNFEIELHETLRKTGFVSKEAIAKMMVKHRQSYNGRAVQLTPDDGFFWVRLSHIRSYFYVYTYAYGELISKAMYAKYKEDKSFVTKIKQFLSAGGSDTPENIFKSIGIDTTRDDFWIAGLKAIEDDVKKLEKLVAKSKKTKK